LLVARGLKLNKIAFGFSVRTELIYKLLQAAQYKLGVRATDDLTQALGLALFGGELTQLELEATVSALTGAPYARIGRDMNRSPDTIGLYVRSALDKLGLSTLADLAKRAETCGTIPLPSGGHKAVALIGTLSSEDLVVVGFLAEGWETAQIAIELGKSKSAITSQMARIHGILGTQSRIEAVRLYIGWLAKQASS
jgi:DNA-binding NarL/FixJ family response regulator